MPLGTANSLGEDLMYGIPMIKALPLWTPSQLTVAAWYDASDPSTITASSGLVSQWNDKSVNGFDLVGSGIYKPTTGTRTQNGMNVLDFIPNNYIVSNGTFTIGTVGITVFAAFNRDSGNTQMFDIRDPLNGVPVFDDLGLGGFGARGRNDANLLRSAGAAVQNTSYNVGVYGWDASNVRYYLNGTATAPNALTGTISTTKITVGGNGLTAPLNCFDGTIAELVFLLSWADDTNRQKVEGYLAWKWNMVANLPAGHPYKATEPRI
jgi:hypothetical protein